MRSFLSPEISLTTQMIERFRSRFEDKIAILHHRLSHGERLDEWERIRAGKAPVVIGPRSCIFSPIPNLGIVIVDEEHEQSYKQAEEAPFYHARDIAVMRGKIVSCPVVLGSATPSLESYQNALSGKYILSPLKARADAAQLPRTTIIDMRREFEKRKGFTIFSDALLTGIEKRTQVGKQTILFLNRRGYHSSVVCSSCAKSLKCTHCDIALTFHKNVQTSCNATFAAKCKPPQNPVQNAVRARCATKASARNKWNAPSMLSFRIYARYASTLILRATRAAIKSCSDSLAPVKQMS